MNNVDKVFIGMLFIVAMVTNAVVTVIASDEVKAEIIKSCVAGGVANG